MREPRPSVKASAPVRLDFAGGWTDVAPFTLRERGAVVERFEEHRRRYVELTARPEPIQAQGAPRR